MEMRSVAHMLLLIVTVSLPDCSPGQRLVPPRKYHTPDDDQETTRKQIEDDYDSSNATTDEQYLGDPCVDICTPLLQNAYCNPETKTCECQKKFPVKLNAATGCTKARRLGEQCWYEASCKYSDLHASCVQIHHNAICQCVNGYHTVSVTKPSRKMFCAEDLHEMTTDFSTLAGVVSGIAILSGLICFVLKLFNQTLYSGRHRYGNANLAPPILFNSDADTSQPFYGSFLAVRDDDDVTGSMPTIIDRRLVSRASSQRTLTSSSRRPSSAPGYRVGGSYASRTGSRRPSIASIHSGNSIRSYSMRRYEKEREQKEEREMQRRLTRLSSSANSSTGRLAPPTPSPHSTDDLLPTLVEDEKNPVSNAMVPLALSEESASNSYHEEAPSTSKQLP